MNASGLPECGAQRYRPAADGLWEPAEPRCPAPPAYDVQLTTDGCEPEWFGMCPEHTAWARANWSAVTGVRMADTLRTAT